MSRINTNVASLNARHQLLANNLDYTTRMQRLSSGLRINTGKDDPAGLIASESLRSEIAGLNAGITNSQRASNVIATAEGSLNEISALLIDINSLLVTSANDGALSDEEIEANQLQIDSAINSIDRIANSTEFQGIKLLNGNRDYTTTGISSTAFDNMKLNSAKLLAVSNNAVDLRAMTVSVAIVVSAQRAEISTTGGTEGFTGALTNKTTVQIGSNRGTAELTFASGTTQAEIMSAINRVKDITGVIASGPANLYSVDFGKDAFVSLDVISGDAAGDVLNSVDRGRDVEATVNGMSITGVGKYIKIKNSLLDFEAELSATLANQTATGTTFTITGGGTTFSLGSKVDAIGLESIGIPNVSSSQLGTKQRTLTVDGLDYLYGGTLNSIKSGGTNQLNSNNLKNAQTIVSQSIRDISTLRGRLGAFQKNVLETNMNSLKVTLENVTASESAIRDADFSAETAALTRSQILTQANTSILSMANSMPQSVLALLGG